MRLFTLLFLIFAFNVIKVTAQPCSGPGRNANESVAVCGTLVFPQANVSSCNGPDLPFMGCTDPVTSSNSMWYKFHCYQSGTLGFLILPNAAGDDYDWELMDYTGHPPGDVYTTNLGVSLNLSAITGPTGCTPAGTGDLHCAGGSAGSQFNRMLPILAGHDYLLMVTNWSNSGLGYNLTFSGTAVLTNNQPPAIANVAVSGCNPSKLKITFSEDVKCSSITPLGTEFTITSGTHVITGITSNCSTGANSVTEITLDLQNPIPPGNYTLTVNDGTDLNTVLDICDDPMPVGSFFDFSVPLIAPVTITNIAYTGCAPTVLDITLSKPVWCTTVTPSGSEFSILPGNPAISSLQSACSTGGSYTDVFHLVLQNPLPHGSYQLQVNLGADGSTFTDTCGNNMGLISIPFTIAQTTVAPVIQSVTFDECHPDKLVINFDKPVNCASLTAAGSEFQVGPGVWPITSIISGCGAATYTSQVVLTLQNPLPGGNFAVNIGNGTDGNTLSDTCYAFMAAGYSKSFVTTQAPAPKFDSLQFDKCNPTFVKAFYSHPILCSSISPDGSDFNITGPSPVAIASASTDPVSCGLGYTKWVLLQFAGPVNTLGNYVLHNKIGSDGNGVIDTCNAKQNTAETIAFSVLIKPSAAFNTQVNWGCIQDTIVLSHPGGAGINTWVWTFPDGSTLSGQTVSKIYPVATPSVAIKLFVDNGFCTDTLTKTVTLGNVFKAGFTSNPLDTFCINTPVSFTDTSSGNITAYLWNFGDLSQFNGHVPPPHIYTVFSNYTVQLIVTDNHGCNDTASRVLHVTPSPVINFSGLRNQYCTGNELVLTRQISPNIDSYTWDNGDGKTFVNKPIVQFSYPNEGVYTITLTGNDKYCGPTQVSKTVPVYAVPKVNLGADTVLCPGERLFLGAAAIPGYTYQWNTGASDAQIYSDIFSRTYHLSVDNHGCRASDDLSIKVLKACLVRVPGAFTPNNDGLNDRLAVLNADMAKNFSFRVYNRMGQLVFNTSNPLDSWDGFIKGSPAETGAYVWVLIYTDGLTGKLVKDKGTSLLLR